MTSAADPLLKYLLYVGVVILIAILVALFAYIGFPVEIPPVPYP